MRDDVYKEFSTRMKAIAKDCLVTKSVADTDYTTYTSHPMEFALNKGSILYYNEKKLIENYSDDIKELFTLIPQQKSRTSVNRSFVFLSKLLSNTALSLQDKSKKTQVLKAQGNMIETFFVFSQKVGLGFLEHNMKIPAFTLMERIPSKYQESPDDKDLIL